MVESDMPILKMYINKSLYKGRFNWHGEVHEFFTKAYSEAQAYQQCLEKLVVRLKRNRWSLNVYFMNNKDSFEVKEVLR